MNIFMQFIYCFLFLIYLAFLPSGGGWAVSLIWAMMILPLADSLMNCLQNLTSRIAGMDSEMMTGKVLGMGAMLGFGLNAIKEQFNSPNSTNGTSNNDNSNPIRDVMQNNTQNNIPNNKMIIPKFSGNNQENMANGNKTSNVNKIAKTGFNATKAYLGMGAKMAEGNFDRSNTYKQNNNKRRLQNVEYINNQTTETQEKIGDKNEFKE